MGGAVSAGENNDDLIDNLVKANYITSKEIEEIFRAVDRGSYYLKEYMDTAYHDLAWRHDHLHISAPCIYSKVMSALDLKPGLSFLNIGSGTGYLSTMVGLCLGISGVNHGIELHEDVVAYAQQKVQEFIKGSQAFNKYTFCEPQFVIGNCLHISPDAPRYDRIYCGAACPSEYESFMKNLLNVNGLLVMPLNDQLQVIKRTEQSRWETENILVVNFATLVVPPKNEKIEVITLPERSPLSLYALCRARIRKVLSDKYHKGCSNRRFKRKPSIDSDSSCEEEFHFRIRRAPGRRPEPRPRRSDNNTARGDPSSPDPDNPNRPDDTDADSRVERRSAILNLISGTVTTVTATRSRESLPSRSDESNAPEQRRSSQSISGTSTSTSQKSDDDDQPSTSKAPVKQKKSRKNKNSGGAEVNGKAKRAKRGWALIRDRIRNRFTEKSIFSPSSKTKLELPSLSAQNASTEVEVVDKSTEENESSQGEAAHQASMGEELEPNPPVTVRSLLLSMADRPMRSLEFERRIHENLANFFNSRRQLRAPRSLEDIDEKSDSGNNSMEEIPLPPDRFQEAILELPLPATVKRFLLYYRTPN